MSIYEKIARIQSRLSNIPLDGEMEMNSSIIKYPTKNNIVDAAKSAMIEEHLVCMPCALTVVSNEAVMKTDRYGGQNRESHVTVRVLFKIVDLETEEAIEESWEGTAKGSSGKEASMASAACVKGFYTNFLNMTMEGDYDEDHLVNEATHKMDMEALRQVFYNKAVYAVNKVTMVKIKELAKKKSRKPETWDLKNMDLNDLTLMISLALDIMAPAKEGEALDNALESIK